MVVDVFVRVAFVTCSTKKAAHFVRGKERYYFSSFLEVESDVFDMMSLHD